MASLTSVLNQLQQECIRLTSQLGSLNHAIQALNGTAKNGTRRGTMSAAGRARIAAAQRNGQALDINGNVLPTRNTPDAHIPLQDFKFNPDLFK